MHVSLSELETTLWKAALGVGLPLGLGEDAGRAARRMAVSPIGSLTAYVDALDAVEARRAGPCDASRAVSGDFAAAVEGQWLSAFHAGPAACDLLVATALQGDGLDRITMAQVDAPAMILFEALGASERIAKALLVRRQTADGKPVEAVCRQRTLDLTLGTPDALLAPGPADLVLGLIDAAPGGRDAASRPIPPDPSVLESGVTVEVATWERLSSYARRRLVEATAASRMTGAGAGLVDRD